MIAHLSRKRQVVLPPSTNRERETRKEVAKILERTEAHYEVTDVEMGKVYRWRPEGVVVECEECGKNPTLTASRHACDECGTDHRAIAEAALGARPDSGRCS